MDNQHRTQALAPLPKPDGRLVPSQDEFAAWCEHPVTRFVAQGWLEAAMRQRAAWSEHTWMSPIGPQAEDLQLLLVELRTRADAYMAFLESSLDDYVKLVAPEENPRSSGPRQDRRRAA
jgi:hypothetical protein